MVWLSNDYLDGYILLLVYNCEYSRRGWVPVPGPHLHVRVQPQPEHRPHHHHHQAAPHLHGQRGLQGTTIKVVYITVISQLFYPFGYRALNTVPYCLKTLLKGTSKLFTHSSFPPPLSPCVHSPPPPPSNPAPICSLFFFSIHLISLSSPPPSTCASMHSLIQF